MSYEEYKALLLKERREVEERLNRGEMYGLGSSMQDSLAELSMRDNHPADIGDELFEREKDLGHRRRNMRYLSMIDDALRKLDEGTYGKCEKCHREISPERLHVIPFARYCTRCQAEVEHYAKEIGDMTRPVEEGLLYPPFGRTSHPGQVEYDGEDAWQDVARYGTSESPSGEIGAYTYGDIYTHSDEDRGYVQEVEKYPREEDTWEAEGADEN